MLSEPVISNGGVPKWRKKAINISLAVTSDQSDTGLSSANSVNSVDYPFSIASSRRSSITSETGSITPRTPSGLDGNDPTCSAIRGYVHERYPNKHYKFRVIKLLKDLEAVRQMVSVYSPLYAPRVTTTTTIL